MMYLNNIFMSIMEPIILNMYHYTFVLDIIPYIILLIPFSLGLNYIHHSKAGKKILDIGGKVLVAAGSVEGSIQLKERIQKELDKLPSGGGNTGEQGSSQPKEVGSNTSGTSSGTSSGK